MCVIKNEEDIKACQELYGAKNLSTYTNVDIEKNLSRLASKANENLAFLFLEHDNITVELSDYSDRPVFPLPTIAIYIESE